MGKRMRPHTLTVPKPLIPVGGKPIVQKIIEDLEAVCGEGIEEVAYIIHPSFGKEVEQKLIDVAGHDWDLKIKSLCFKIVKSLWRSQLKDFSTESFSNLLPKLTNYLGSIESKDQISIRYRIALVVENSLDYVSEKLFEALSCKNIVVYVGPELQHFGLNDQMVIRVAPNINSIFSELKNILHLNEEEQFKILERQQLEYTKIVGEWDNRAVLEKMAKGILEKIQSKPIE
jgi:hypothetical protein